MHIGTRLKEERERLGLSQTALADRASVTRKTQFNYEEGERVPDADYLVAVAGAGVDVLYVLMGTKLPIVAAAAKEAVKWPAATNAKTALELQDAPRTNPTALGVSDRAYRDEMTVALTRDTLPLVLSVANKQGRFREYQVIPQIQGQASAGKADRGGHATADPIVNLGGEMAFTAEWLERQVGIHHGQLVSIRVTGDSMAPTITDGDTVIVDTEDRKVTVSGVYVIAPHGRYQLKRIHLRMDGSLKIMSDNAAYEPEVLAANQVEGLGVVGRMVWPKAK